MKANKRKGCDGISTEQQTLRRTMRYVCRRVCRWARKLPEDTDAKTIRELVQVLKELTALTRELDGTDEGNTEAPRIRLEGEVQDFAQ